MLAAAERFEGGWAMDRMMQESPPAEGGTVRRGWRVAALILGLLVLIQNGHYFYMASGHHVGGSIGLRAYRDCRGGFCLVDFATDGMPAARAGLTAGDRVRLDRSWETVRSRPPGEPVGLTVRHGAEERHLVLRVAPRMMYAPTYMITAVADTLVVLIAMLIIARAGTRRWSLLLGLALLAYTTPGNYPRLWQNAPLLFPGFLIGLSAFIDAAPVLMLAALRGFRAQVTGIAPRWLDRLVWGAAIGEAACTALGLYVTLGATSLPPVTDGLTFMSLGGSVGSILAPVALAAGWRHVPVGERTRYAFMWAAVSTISLLAAVDPIIMLTGNNYVEASWPVVIQLGAVILGALLFGYAILRHRVVDLGFAVNRTLVYSTLSFAMLALFGLVEWGSEKLLPFESHQASAIVDAGLALGIFLVFHRLQEYVEHGVERLFFHQWRLNEAALHRFVDRASYITRPEILLDRAVEELRRFTGGAGVALFRWQGGRYALAAGDGALIGTSRDADDPALVALRADRRALHDGYAPGDLVLPMLHRAEVLGFVALGPKPSGEPYRPDEEAALAAAVHQIGLDLHALRVEELERDNALLATRLSLAPA